MMVLMYSESKLIPPNGYEKFSFTMPTDCMIHKFIVNPDELGMHEINISDAKPILVPDPETAKHFAPYRVRSYLTALALSRLDFSEKIFVAQVVNMIAYNPTLAAIDGRVAMHFTPLKL